MRKHDALSRLREHADAIRAIGATSMYLFGSTARDEACEAGDLDLFVDYNHDSRFSAIELLRIKHISATPWRSRPTSPPATGSTR